MSKPVQYLKEVRAELLKTVWPSRKEAIRLTVAVIGVSLSVAIILGLADLGLTKLLSLVIK